MSADIVIEKVPRFVRRYGDYVAEGSNNTIIIFGTDRAKKGPAGHADGLGHVKAQNKGAGTGTIHIIAGRAAQDPDFEKDDSFIYITRKSKIDDNLGIGGVEKATNDKPSIAIKSDVVRIVGRKDIKICANDDEKHYMFFDGEKIKINFNNDATITIVDKKVTVKMGSNVIEMNSSMAKVEVASTKLTLDGSLVKIDAPRINLVGGCGKPLDDLLKDLATGFSKHTHMTAVGPATPPVAGVGPGDSPEGPGILAKYGAWNGLWNPS